MDQDELDIDSDDEHVDRDFSTAGQRQEHCTICGSTRFYRDDNDNLVCSDCYTQSQTLSQRETADLEDVFSNAKRGTLRRSRHLVRRNASRDEDLDNSQPLPDLDTCLFASQLILKIMAEKAFILAHVSAPTDSCFEKEKRTFLHIVGDIWFRYLKAWQLGAEHYLQIYPELRFSMRDFFLNRMLRGMVVKHLSARAVKDLKKRKSTMNDPTSSPTLKTIKGGDEIRQKKRVKFDDDSILEQRSDNIKQTSKSDHDSHLNDPKVSTRRQARKHRSVRYFRPTCRTVSVLRGNIPLKQGEQISKEHAAVDLEPSSSFLASVVYLALMQLRKGVASMHIRSWLSNGSIPYGKAAFNMLPKKLQDSLVLIQPFFHANLVPSCAFLEQNADLLIIACGISHPDSGATDHDYARSQMHGFPGKGIYVSTYIKRIGVEQRKPTGSLFVDNIPLMAMRFIADLGLSQKVLDYSLALMGLFTPEEKTLGSKIWLPPTLNVASPGRLVSPIHILAVIVVACKMCKGWEKWSIFIRKQNLAKSGDGVMQSLGQRFVPSSESHLNLVNNGDLLEQYFDFLEESVAPAISQVPQYEHLLASWGNFLTDQGMLKPQSNSIVQPCSAIAGIHNPLLQIADDAREANGYGNYTVYDDFRSHTHTIARTDKSVNSSPPFHSHYGLLIEYISYVFSVEPSELHYVVACCDEELVKLGRKVNYE